MTPDLLIQVSFINYAVCSLSGVEKVKYHETRENNELGFDVWEGMFRWSGGYTTVGI